MGRRLLVGLGALLLLVGLVWTLQGVGVLGGSAMTGHARWALLGPVVALAGVVLMGRTRQHRR